MIVLPLLPLLPLLCEFLDRKCSTGASTISRRKFVLICVFVYDGRWRIRRRRYRLSCRSFISFISFRFPTYRKWVLWIIGFRFPTGRNSYFLSVGMSVGILL